MKHVLIVLILVLFIPVLLISLLKVPISRAETLKPLRLLVQLFCPPKDLFEFVMDRNIDIAKMDDIQTFEFKIKYVGPYSIGILLDNFSKDLYRKKYELKLRLKLDFYSDGALLTSKETTDDYTPFFGKRGNGFILSDFISPEEIPLDKKITCKLTIIAPDRELYSKYAPIKLYIQKMSEE